ncbi:MAG: hypothetical protein ABL982_24945 [Vicinamibacterales bacterium]
MVDGRQSRRDFLRLRRTERGRVLEVSCHTLFMRCADATLAAPADLEWEPGMGEPPAVFERPSLEDLVETFGADLCDAQVLRLTEPEWMASVHGAERFEAVIAAFRARGGIVE